MTKYIYHDKIYLERDLFSSYRRKKKCIRIVFRKDFYGDVRFTVALRKLTKNNEKRFFPEHRHLRTIVQGGLRSIRSIRIVFDMFDRFDIQKTQKFRKATFEGIKPNVPRFFRIGI